MPKDFTDKEPAKWVTIKGHRVPIYEGDSREDVIGRLNGSMGQNRKATADEKTQAEHQRVVKELSKDKYPDYNTYDAKTLKPVKFPNGYQVTFCQIGDDYTPEEYAKKVNECLALSSNGRAYGGKFESTPEISFHCNNKEQAIAYAKANNQISVWDWEKDEEIKTGGTGRRK